MLIEDIERGGVNVPVTRFPDVDSFDPGKIDGAVRYAATIDRDIDLEALCVNKGSDVLIVGFHGALTRETTELPRFERLDSLLQTPYSLMFFSDPTLRISDDMQLSWYVGWEGADLRPMIAAWADKVALATGAKHVVFLGASGGGFASLQASAFLPGSTAITINPQTVVNSYLVEGKHYGPQLRFVARVFPHLMPVPALKMTPEHDWYTPLGERVSAVETYKRPIDNRVLFVQNSNDHSHVESHYGPFHDVIDAGPNKQNVRFEYYEGPKAHVAQTPEITMAAVETAVAWAREQ